jgi:hypothetical protein
MIKTYTLIVAAIVGFGLSTGADDLQNISVNHDARLLLCGKSGRNMRSAADDQTTLG